MSTIPIFGEILPKIHYVERPGAYGLLRGASGGMHTGTFAVVRTPMGFFLPGGGVDLGESYEEALKRELNEEIGYDLLLLKLFAEAVQYHWSEYYQKHFKKRGKFFLLDARPISGRSCEAEHELLWWDLSRLKTDLTQEFQRWAASQAAPSAQ